MKILIVDCLGCVFDESFYSHIQEPPLSEADFFRLKYENAKRSIENQQSTHDYLKACEKFVMSKGYDDLYFVGTNGEVLTASLVIEPFANHYSNAPKYIGTVDKFHFIKDFLDPHLNDITMVTDQYFVDVYSALNTKHDLKVKFHSIERIVTEEEVPNISETMLAHKLN